MKHGPRDTVHACGFTKTPGENGCSDRDRWAVRFCVVVPGIARPFQFRDTSKLSLRALFHFCFTPRWASESRCRISRAVRIACVEPPLVFCMPSQRRKPPSQSAIQDRFPLRAIARVISLLSPDLTQRSLLGAIRRVSINTEFRIESDMTVELLRMKALRQAAFMGELTESSCRRAALRVVDRNRRADL